MDAQESLQIYYDGACHLCSKEIEHYRHKDTEKRLHFIDISNPLFDAKAEGLNPQMVQKYFHVKTAAGETLTGVSAFAKIWQTLGIFKTLDRLYRTPGTRQLMDFGYLVFAQIRPLLPKKDCDSGHCQYR